MAKSATESKQGEYISFDPKQQHDLHVHLQKRNGSGIDRLPGEGTVSVLETMTTSLSTAALKSARTFELPEDLSTINPHERITQDKTISNISAEFLILV